jgi:hypothetical protein
MAFSAATKLPDREHRRRIVRPSDDVRYRALARLYERRSAVDNLISALEHYQQEQRGLTAQCPAASAEEMSS